jgi:hypothetical protein
VVLVPQIGLALNDFSAGVEFFQSLPSLLTSNKDRYYPRSLSMICVKNASVALDAPHNLTHNFTCCNNVIRPDYKGSASLWW